MKPLELDPETYRHLVKNICASCGKEIGTDPQMSAIRRYEVRGNWCKRCDYRVKWNIAHRKKLTEEDLDRIFRG